MKRVSPLLVLARPVACGDQPLSTAPNAGLPRFDVADAARAYKKGFYRLPRMVSRPVVTGTFDAALSPAVEIRKLAGDAFGPVTATYTTTTGPNGEYLRVQVEDGEFGPAKTRRRFRRNRRLVAPVISGE